MWRIAESDSLVMSFLYRSLILVLGLLAVPFEMFCCCAGERCTRVSCASCWCCDGVGGTADVVKFTVEVVIESNAVVLPSKRPWTGSIVDGNVLLAAFAEGDNVCVVLLMLLVKASWATSNDRVVSPAGKLVTFVRELFGVNNSSIL